MRVAAKRELNHHEIVENHKEKALKLTDLKNKVARTRLILHELNYDYKDLRREATQTCEWWWWWWRCSW